jgi:PUA domain protein
MPEKHRRHFLKDKETKTLLSKASEKIKIDWEQLFKGKTGVEVVETEFAEVFLINGRPLLAKTGENVYPTLVFDELFALAPKVVVDMGAVPYVCKGASVMAPGIRRFEGEFRKGDIVFVVDEKHGKALAVGEILYSMEEARKVKQGIVVKNSHFVSDRLWDFLKNAKATPIRT